MNPDAIAVWLLQKPSDELERDYPVLAACLKAQARTVKKK